MKKQKKVDAKKTMLPHSQAKLDFYKDYLKRYIPILRLAKFTTSVNIFDVFCGTGIYENGKKGSPIIAFEAIKNSEKYASKTSQHLTPVNLYVNDLDSSKIDQVKQYIESQSKKACNLEFHNEDATVFLSSIENIIKKQKSSDRNLILIDPYGYKNIRKEFIENLIKNKRNTELILFLPISQMYRFIKSALKNEQCNVGALKEFLISFFPNKNHPIYTEQLSDEKNLIEYICNALSFGDKYHSTSYYIQRDNKNHYYALFFVTPSIYGLEKILEVKWQLNEEHGEGFEQPKQMKSLFDNIEKENIKIEQYNKLEKLLLDFISANKFVNNNQLYELTLKNMYLKKHSNEVLRNLQQEDKIVVTDFMTQEKARKGSFYLGYNYYKKGENKVLISMN